MIKQSHNEEGRGYSLPEQRRGRILQHLRERGYVRVAELAQLLDVSQTTLIRDLQILDRRGLVARVHGGAITPTTANAPSPPEAPAGAEDPSPNSTNASCETIARHAATLVAPNTVIAIAADIIAVPLAQRLTDVENLTVVTNSIAVSTVLTRHGRADQMIILTGGVRSASDALIGPLAEAAARFHAVRQSFVGAYGVSKHRGFTAADIGEAAVNRAMLTVAETRIIWAHHAGRNADGIATFAPLSYADLFITDDGLPASTRHELMDEIGHVMIVNRQRPS